MENADIIKALSAAGFIIKAKTTVESICIACCELNIEMYYEWARELKAFARKG
jgi:hypothetical protein